MPTMDELENSNEVIYGSLASPTSEDNRVMSERVQNLANSVYREFERLIKAYDENVVKELMPLVVSILEGLDQAVQEKQEVDVELELVKEDNEQLMTQYEREKQLKRSMEMKYLEFEEVMEEDQKKLKEKSESLESIVRLFEIKMKNAQDQITRHEERETEYKKDYNKLHERYTDLFKAHVDYRERMKLLLPSGEKSGGGEIIGTKRSAPAAFPPQPAVETPVAPGESDLTLHRPAPSDSPETHRRRRGNSPSFQSELDMLQSNDGSVEAKRMGTERVEVQEKSTETRVRDSVAHILPHDSVAIFEETFSDPADETDAFSNHDTKEVDYEENDPADSGDPHNTSSVFDELQNTDALSQVDDGSDIADDIAADHRAIDDDALSVSDNFYGMSREVENLIQENNELLTTKNALNVVNHDLIAKVDELTSEKDILREEVSCLQVMKQKQQERLSELELEIKKLKDAWDLEKQQRTSGNPGEEEDEVPMAQRKRFTRVEMARVLMERNQYKERLMELQEAVRWTEMIRASKEHPELMGGTKKKSSGIWNLFSGLFSSSAKPIPPKKTSPVATVHYTAGSTVKPVGDPNREQRERQASATGRPTKAFDFLQDDIDGDHSGEDLKSRAGKSGAKVSDRARRDKEQERRQAQYKEMRAAVKKDDGRMQAYGWSLPAKLSVQLPPADSKSSGMGAKACLPVPVPIYCRPILEGAEAGTTVWCAAAVNLSGGKTRDGGSIVGASVFYTSDESSGSGDTVAPNSSASSSDVERLNEELQSHEKAVRKAESDGQSSSLIWICTHGSNGSEVTVVDANSPGDILENFHVCSTHLLCISSVPGAMEGDYSVSDELIKCDAEISDTTSSSQQMSTTVTSPTGDQDSVDGSPLPVLGLITLVHCEAGSLEEDSSEGNDLYRALQVEQTAAKSAAAAAALGLEGSPQSSTGSGSLRAGTRRRLRGGESSELIKDGISTSVCGDEVIASQVDSHGGSVLPTMWLGSQSGSIYVHSSVSRWKRCLHTVRLKDSILAICHVRGRVFVALADGTVAVFRRASNGQWDLTSYHLIDLGRGQHSVRCLTVVADKHVWCGYRNNIHIINAQSLALEKTFDAHPRRESQVRLMCWAGDGVWISIRLDSTLRLYHAYTHNHLQDVDVEPYVSKILGTGKLGFSFVRISCLMISCSRLWVGTGNGVVISIPLSETVESGILTSISASENKQTVGHSVGISRPGGVVRVYSDGRNDSVIPGSFIPYCSIAQAQLSFHGHKDAIKFFLTTPGAQTRGLSGVVTNKSSPDKDTDLDSSSRKESAAASKTTLIISGGQGYVDFRIGEAEEDESVVDVEERKAAAAAAVSAAVCEAGQLGSKGDQSHLIVWQIISAVSG